MKNIGSNTTIEITANTIIKAILLVICAMVAFELKDIILVILTAIVIASAFEPAVVWLIKKGLPRVLSVVIMYALVGSIIIGAFYTLLPQLLEDTSQFLNSVPHYLDTASLWNPLGGDVTTDTKNAATVAENMSVGLQTVAQTRLLTTATVNGSATGFSVQGAIQSIDDAISSVSAGFIHSASSVFGGILALVLIIVLSFYLAVQEDGVEKALRLVLPDGDESYIINVWRRTQAKIGRWMQGQIVLAILVGLMVYLGLTVLGVKDALLFAVLAALLETIPLFGPIIAAVPAVAVAYSDGGTSAGIIVAGFYLIIHQFENHLIYPLVVKKIVGVPPILVILSLIVGYKLAGFLGLILSVPVASMLVELIDDLEKRRKVAA